MSILVVYAKNVEPEHGIPALLSLIDGAVCAGILPHEGTMATVDRLLGGTTAYKLVVLLGNYMEPVLEEAAAKYAAVEFFMFSYGMGADRAERNVRVRYMNGTAPPSVAVLDYLSGRGDVSALFFIVAEHNRKLLSLVDDRLMNRNMGETEPFFSGFYTYDFGGAKTSTERFIKLMSAPALLDEVMKAGRTAIALHISMATERAAKNSMVVTLNDGVTAAISSAPELVNQTHAALRQKYSADVTVTTNIEYASGTPRVFFSVRSNVDNFSAEVFVRQLDDLSGSAGNPGGSQKGAGVRVPASIPAFSVFAPTTDAKQ